MKAGTENRKKTIAAGALGAIALTGVISMLWSNFGGSSAPTPPPSVIPAKQPATRIGGAIAQNNAAAREASKGNSGGGNQPATGPTLIAGVDAEVLASTSTSLDPTLHPDAMLRAEHLAYAGNGRNIFSASYVPVIAPANIPKPIASVRKNDNPVIIQPKPQPITCPPSCPPINLKFFGTMLRANGVRQALLLSGDDVLLALPGEIVARKYKIVSVGPNSLQVEDLANNNTQTLPLLVN